MKTIISTLVIFLMAAAISLNAQPRFGNGSGNGMNGIHPFIAQHGTDLNLTDDQMKDIAELNLEYRQEFRANRQGYRSNRGAGRDGRRANRSTEWSDARAEYHSKIMDILSDDQKQILRSTMRERVENTHQFRMIQHEVILDEAGIEGDKRQQVLTLMNDHSMQMMESRLENLETPGNFGRYRGEGVESRTELHNQLKELLTAAEYQNLREVMGTPRAGNYDRMGRRSGNSRFNR